MYLVQRTPPRRPRLLGCRLGTVREPRRRCRAPCPSLRHRALVPLLGSAAMLLVCANGGKQVALELVGRRSTVDLRQHSQHSSQVGLKSFGTCMLCSTLGPGNGSVAAHPALAWRWWLRWVASRLVPRPCREVTAMSARGRTLPRLCFIRRSEMDDWLFILWNSMSSAIVGYLLGYIARKLANVFTTTNGLPGPHSPAWLRSRHWLLQNKRSGDRRKASRTGSWPWCLRWAARSRTRLPTRRSLGRSGGCKRD